jgi:hypothetical protein
VSEDHVITVWERYNRNSEKWEHNHISDGFNEIEETPAPKSNVQKKSWAGGEWRKKKAHLEGLKVVHE